MEPNNETIGGEVLEAEGRSNTLAALAGLIVTIGGAVGISAMEKAGLVDLETVMQVAGWIGPVVAGTLGGVLYAKRS